MSKKFRLGENCDSPINEQLATNVTDIFRNGISQECYRDLFKDEKLTRPQNCEGLVTVQTLTCPMRASESIESSNNLFNSSLASFSNTLSNLSMTLDKTVRISSKIRGRGSFRGRRPWLRFRGRGRGRGQGRGLGRGYSHQADNYKAAAETTNSRFTHNKYRN
jgi:hypothetical protein